MLASLPVVGSLLGTLGTVGGDEGAPQDMLYGERWAHRVVEAVLRSPAWPRTLLIYTYDEHGGYYDHVPPPAAIPPDSIPPQLTPGDVPGGYDTCGPRVPAVVASPYAKPHAVTDIVHDHTSILATIEAKCNLPALTYRDANAATVMDFLDAGHAFMTPPAIQGPLAHRPIGARGLTRARERLTGTAGPAATRSILWAGDSYEPTPPGSAPGAATLPSHPPNDGPTESVASSRPEWPPTHGERKPNGSFAAGGVGARFP